MRLGASSEVEVSQINKGGHIRILRIVTVILLTALLIQLKPPYKHSEAHPLTDKNFNNSVTEVHVKEQTVATQVNEIKPLIQEPVVEPSKPESTQAVSSSCVDEIKKYDWNQSVAYNVMMVESGNNHNIVNDNPSTGDYSVGCFQINLYGNLRNTRPDESWLKVPANNVAYAYQLYTTSGWKPWGATTCKYKVNCY